MAKQKPDENRSTLPKQMEDFLKAMARFLNWLAKTMEDTADFISRLVNRILEAIFDIVKSIVKWIARITDDTFKFIVSLCELFWSIKKQIAIYMALYIPSLIFWMLRLRTMAKLWTTFVLLITIVMAFLKVKKQTLPKNPDNPAV